MINNRNIIKTMLQKQLEFKKSININTISEFALHAKAPIK